jgi:hypothetical protein
MQWDNLVCLVYVRVKALLYHISLYPVLYQAKLMPDHVHVSTLTKTWYTTSSSLSIRELCRILHVYYVSIISIPITYLLDKVLV